MVLAGCESNNDGMAKGNSPASGDVRLAGSNNLVPVTEADAITQEIQNLEQKRAMLRQGEQLVLQGQTQKARGQFFIEQGNTYEGQPLVAQGEADIQRGQEILRRARAMETKVQPIDSARTADRAQPSATDRARTAGQTLEQGTNAIEESGDEGDELEGFADDLERN
jgi:hypothetical protein